MIRRINVRRSVLAAVEHALVVLSVGAAAALRLGWGEIASTAGLDVLWRASLIAIVLQVSLHYCDLYDFRTLRDRRALVVGLVQALGAASLVLALLYYWIPELIIGRGVFLLASLIIVDVVAGWRIFFEWFSLHLAPAERLLIVGTNAAAVALARELFDRRGELGVELVGFVDPDKSRVGMPVINPGVIGTVADIPAIVRSQRVDRVVVSLADARGKLPMDSLLEMKLNDGVRFDHLASVYEQYTGKIAVENLRPSWMVFSEGFRKSRGLSAVKRIVDVALACAGLILSMPVMAIVACAVKTSSPGPVFYHQARVGREGRVFTIHKFRSMRRDAEAATGAVWATPDDPRVTPIGRFLRRTRLDELPQLWNVLNGDMSFVGPRPERPEFVKALRERIPFFGQRHVVRPGITGWAQINERYAADLEGALQKLQFDLFYIKHMSIAFDLYVVIETIKTVLVRPGS